MIDREVAEIFAAQTAMISALSEELIEVGAIDRERFVNRLYRLIEETATGGPPSSRTAPVRHLISLLERVAD